MNSPAPPTCGRFARPAVSRGAWLAGAADACAGRDETAASGRNGGRW